MSGRTALWRSEGEQNAPVPWAKLTEADARHIRSAASPVKQLAREHGVSPKTVREIRQGITWRWL